jgi:hypothetical protein
LRREPGLKVVVPIGDLPRNCPGQWDCDRLIHLAIPTHPSATLGIALVSTVGLRR